MYFNALFFLCILSMFAFLNVSAGGGGKEHETVKIIIPVHKKTIKHTHTIYKTVHHNSKDDLGLDEAIGDHGWQGGFGGFGGSGGSGGFGGHGWGR